MAKATKPLELSKEDIDGHYWVKVILKPDSPRDKLMESQLVAAYRQPGPDGKPFMSRKDVAALIGVPHPEELDANVDMEIYEAASEEVKKYKDAALWARWKELHRDTVRTAERELEPDAQFRNMVRSLTRDEFDKLVEMAAAKKQAEMMGQDPQAMLMQAQAAGAMMQSNADNEALLPASVRPPTEGVAPTLQPTQMAMPDASAQTGVIPAVQEAGQIQRGRAVNK